MDRAEIKESFDHFDRDGDGRIDLLEFGELCRALGGEIDDAHRDVGFREIDTNGNHAIDFDEFLAWWTNAL